MALKNVYYRGIERNIHTAHQKCHKDGTEFHFTQTLSVIARNGFHLSQYTSTPGFIFTSFWIRQMAYCTTSILHQLDVTICIPFSVRTIIKCIF